MQHEFKSITILGGGLLGGSIALAAQTLAHEPAVRLWARRAETARQAQSLGIHKATHDLPLAVAGADLCILCVPVGAMPALLETAIASGLPESCLVTDVGSVKATPHRTLSHLGRRFIGSHPMAGSEKKGIEAIHASLMDGAACLITLDSQSRKDDQASIESFWTSLGCKTACMSPESHDALVARISHLPHIAAASVARVGLSNPADGAFAGGGLRDTTRIAGGDPIMWAEILMENRDALFQPIRETIDDLSEILALLEQGNHEALRCWLEEAKARRDAGIITP